MSGRRRKNSSSIVISLFSFQDIITCLSGVMILIVLLTAVNIVAGKLDIGESMEQKIPDGGKLSCNREELLKQEIEQLKKVKKQSERELSAYRIRQEELRKQLTQLDQKSRSISRQSRTISFIPAEEGENRNQRALLIECSEELIRSEVVNHNPTARDKKSPTAIFSTDRKGILQLLHSLEKLDKSREYPLFIIKPSASDYAMQLIRQVQSMGFDVGYDAMVEEESVAFEERGQ